MCQIGQAGRGNLPQASAVYSFRTNFILKLIIAAIVLAAAPGDSLADQLKDQVDGLVRELNADQLKEREAAEASLVGLGPKALAHLPADLDRLPAEVSQRIRRIRQQLEQAQADEAVRASVVTLNAKNKPVRDILADISKQTGNKVVDYREQFGEDPVDQTVSVEFSKTPFWQALDHVLDQASLTTYAYGEERGIYLVNRPARQLARSVGASYVGPFRVEAVRIEASRELRQKHAGSLKLLIAISWEPRLAPIAITHPLETLKITGDDGGLLAVDGSEGQPEAEVQDAGSTVELELPLVSPKRSVAKISKLSGKFHALLQGPVETFRFEQLRPTKAGQVQAAEQRRGDVVVSIERLRKNREIWECTLRVRFDNPAAALETHRGWILANPVYFADSAGKQIVPGGYELVSQTPKEVGVKYLFELPSGPQGLSLVYKTPLAILQVPISYELEGIDLP